jgi:hypothetical protein
MGVKAAQQPEPPSGFNYTEHNCNTEVRPRRSRGRFCGAWTMVGPFDGKYNYVRSRCKSYRCELCGPRKIRHVRKSIVRHAIENRLQRFLTLTLDPKKFPVGVNLIGKISYLKNCWRKMREYIRRKLGKSVCFIAVMELQRNGNPHLHALIGSYLDKAWITSAWQALGGGSFTRIEMADIHRVAAYVSKYISEEGSLVELPDGVRRFSTSRGLPLFECSKPANGWQLAKMPIDRLRARCTGVEIETFDDSGELVSFVAGDLAYIYEPRWGKTNRWKEIAHAVQMSDGVVGSL